MKSIIGYVIVVSMALAPLIFSLTLILIEVIARRQSGPR